MSSCTIPDCIKVIIADDHELVREALGMHLQIEPDMTLVASVANGKDLFNTIESSPETIDIIIADFNMPDGGLSNLNKIKRKYPQTKILVLTGIQQEEVLKQIRLSQVDMVIKKNGESKQIFQIIRKLHSSECPMPKLSSESKPLLSHKEYLILQHIADGLSNPKIGELLFISPKTVDTHRQHLMRKLDVHSAPELIKKALIKGLLV